MQLLYIQVILLIKCCIYLYGLISFLTLAQSLVDLCPCVEDDIPSQLARLNVSRTAFYLLDEWYMWYTHAMN